MAADVGSESELNGDVSRAPRSATPDEPKAAAPPPAPSRSSRRPRRDAAADDAAACDRTRICRGTGGSTWSGANRTI